jgi:short-subunit dehydrogenase
MSTHPKTKTALIVGGTSAIALALAEKLLRSKTERWEVILAGRSISINRLESARRHLGILCGDASRCRWITGTPDYIWGVIDTCQLLVIASGFLPNTPALSSDKETLETFEANTLLPIKWCETAIADISRHDNPKLLKKICVIGSVAGDRGRSSNYIYGAAKAAIATYCEGLAHRLALIGKHAPKVMLIKPGPTRSGMTQHIKDSLLLQSPEKIAGVIHAALQNPKSPSVCYAPSWWKLIMDIIKQIPEKIIWKTKM